MREPLGLGGTHCLRPASTSVGNTLWGGRGGVEKAASAWLGASRHFSVTAVGLASLGQGREGGGRDSAE